MENQEICTQIQTLMREFFHKAKGYRVVNQDFPHNVYLSNQKSSLTNPYGKIKSDTGRETITLYQRRLNQPDLVLARLAEQENGELQFEDIALMEHVSVLPVT